MNRLRWPGIVLIGLGVGLRAGPARASLVNTYGSSDDAWSPPLAAGHMLLDARMSPPVRADLPLTVNASLVYGLGRYQEVGLSGGYTWSGLGTAQASSAPAVLTPYFKVQLPWKPGGTTLGLVGGFQLPTRPAMSAHAALETVAALPLTSALTLDLNLGIGRSLVTSANLGHGAVSLYCVGPGDLIWLVEAFTSLSSLNAPTFGQHLALTLPVSGSLSWDLGVTINKASDGAIAWTPQLGASLTR